MDDGTTAAAARTSDGPAPADLAARLAEVERRLALLEGASGAPAPVAEDDGPDPGWVHYRGEVALHGDVTWDITLDATTAVGLADEPRVAVLAALGHPARARIVEALLVSGPSGTTALQEAAGLASTGQLYHHLRALTHCGLVDQDGRGSYRIAPRTVVPALVLLTAAADVAGQLRGLN